MYCRPGIEGAHEKGGVEGQIGYFRRNHFVPVPEASSLAEPPRPADRPDSRPKDPGYVSARVQN